MSRQREQATRPVWLSGRLVKSALIFKRDLFYEENYHWFVVPKGAG